MALSTLILHTAVLSVAAGTTAVLAAVTYRRRETPGAAWFAALMACLSIWSLTYSVGLHVGDSGLRAVLLRIQWTAIPFITVTLFLFAATYTGLDEVLSRRTIAAIVTIPVLTVIAVWTNPWHHIFWIRQDVLVVDGMALMDPTFGSLFWVYTIYSYTLVAVSMALIIRLVYHSEYLFTEQSALVLVGIAAPFVVNIVDVFVGASGPKVDYTPVAFTITGVTFGYALFRRQLFDLVPATRKIGRDAAIAQLDTGIVIVDVDRRIVYCNDAAANVVGCDPAAALGKPVDSMVGTDALDFETDDALAELKAGGRIHEIRTSPITDRHGRLIGHTLVVHDVTARTERERELASQRDELATLNQLNAVIRGVNQALVTARSREAIEQSVCERFADADRYRTVCVADIPTWTGDADRWTLAGDDGATPPTFDDAGPGDAVENGCPATTVTRADDDTDWTVIPIVYGRTVYGAIGFRTDREVVGEREREILGELGETIGHAINAVETRRMLSAESVVELDLACEDGSDPLVAVTRGTDRTIELEGVVPGGENGPLAYLTVEDTDVERVREALAAAASGGVRTISASDDGKEGLLEWEITGVAPMGALEDHGATVHRVTADGGRTKYELAVTSDADARTIVEHLQDRFQDVEVLGKRPRCGPFEAVTALPETSLDDLTERQREVLEAAYRAGYFNWPRDSNAEEVAESLGISSATLHSHLRKAEKSLLGRLFESREESGDTERLS
ncbi:histidine kinase N-terminal 7TM domain-containing protein [Halorhabdus amylolytica]|uniref:histidine kinase N-terminal 7TM domain-containing protein n=1 Tax=Halorhabdus amylolytica TaxID=2559573 RepID=UPI00145B0D5F|nr:histidine kinase N-terminal 7TM domain-containing protein [Halorhabdus amylolytica]